MRAWSTAMVMGFMLAPIALTAQGKDPRVGMWHLDVAKSKYSPGPPPKSQMLTVEASGQGEKVTSEMISADGKKTVTQYTANFDGKDYPLTGSPNGDTVSLKRVDSHTTERTDKMKGKPTVTYTRVVAKDGRTMTVTIKGTTPAGQTLNNVVVFEKH